MNGIGLFLVAGAAPEEKVTPGCVPSYFLVSRFEALLSLPARSFATAADILAVTSPSPSGMRFALQIRPGLFSEIPTDNVALPRDRSAAVKPVTRSLKVMVSGIGLPFVGAVDVSVTVGTTVS